MGGQTGVATSEAFARSGKAMAAKSAELQHGGEILMKSGQALKNAEDEHRSLGAQPGAPTEPTYDSGSPQTKAELRQHSEHQAAAAAWQAEYDRREKRAEKANQELEQALRSYSDDMAKIHGENMDKPSSVQGGSGSVAAPGGGGTAYGGGSGGGHAGGGGRGDQSHAQGEVVDYVPGHHGTTTPPPTTGPPPSGGDVGAGAGSDTGTIGAPAASAQGGSPVLGQTALTGATGGSISPASSATGSAIGAGGLAVAAGGGLMAAGASPASAIRGGLVASPSAAAGGGSARSIGAGAARGAASTLGRPSSVVAGGSPTTSSSARSAGGGATGRGTTSSRAGVAGQAGSQAGARGASGSGRAAAGAAAPGAAARGGGKDKRRNGRVVDHLLEEWEVDEEDLGPAVID
jgi:hypothetical protein